MTQSGGDLHVYLRSIERGERSSLSVLAGLVTAGARVLDLGTGSGALGRYLREHSGCTVDGVTINEREAALARPHYRRVEIADLETPDWPSLFTGERYDFIVCADVLEHLRQPEVALEACRTLLASSGQVLISIPNAAYSGLVAELMLGDFRYREEGLLDRTHLRFFTRRSLERFLAAQGWAVQAMEAIERPLNESEFQVFFDQLPPAVARYILAQPDAGTYQLVAAARPLPAQEGAAEPGATMHPAEALFSAQLYLGQEGVFSESRKLVTPGVIGKSLQRLRFAIPVGEGTVSRLRLDPADRPGFLHLHSIALLAGSDVAWQWRSEIDGLAALQACRHQGIELSSPWPGSVALALLYGNDPQLELPIPESALTAALASGQAAVEVELGWPMSADYMALAQTITPLHERIAQLGDMTHRAQVETGQVMQVAADAHERIGQLDREREELRQQLATLEGRHKDISEEKNLLTRQRLALQSELRGLVSQYEALAQHLRWIENSTVFRMTRPLVHTKMALQRWLGRQPAADMPATASRAQPMEPSAAVVDVIVPVYRGLADTQRCIQAVLASRCLTPWRLVVINDASPEPEVTGWLRQVSAQDNRIVLLENEHNLGFVGTVNRGMALADGHDCLLLNSDTEVANDWLDRLRKAAYSDARVASVTPFSNNATICSYPRFCKDNELPPDVDTARLDALFAATNPGQTVDVPTGVGFCMYIRRDCLNAVGLFDVEQFGKGYGEENDFCRRAADAGWRNLHALDTFVLHTGGVSFGASKSQREIDAVEKLRRLHPSYDSLVHDFVAADPARTARLAVDLARVQARELPRILAVTHNRVGGTLRHAVELAGHLKGNAIFFLLSPAPGASVALELVEPGAGFRLEFSVPGEWPSLLDVLRSLGVSHIHFHHLLGHSDLAPALGRELGVGWDFTAHDFYAMCPQISLTGTDDRYCGEQGDGQCKGCLGKPSAANESEITAWRERYGFLLTQARHVLAPSRDTARRFIRMWPAADLHLAPHTDVALPSGLPMPAVKPRERDKPLKIVVLGGLSRIKGADVLESVAGIAAKQRLPLEFHLIGHAYRSLLTQPRAALTVHGAYEDKDLPQLLDWLQPDLVWFPALWPETYSYTLSASLHAGLPVVAPDIGAFAERLEGRPWSWVKPWDTTPSDWALFFEKLRVDHFMTATAPPSPAAPAQAADNSRIKSWSYDAQYLAGIPALPFSTLPQSLLAAHSLRGKNVPLTHPVGMKKAALTALVRLRSTRGLRLAARAIPHRLQRRVKTWLLG